jgi:hypothetical protein
MARMDEKQKPVWFRRVLWTAFVCVVLFCGFLHAHWRIEPLDWTSQDEVLSISLLVCGAFLLSILSRIQTR